MQRKIYTLDRYEEEYAILIDDEMNTINVLRKFAPNAKEGDKLYFHNGIFYVDATLTINKAQDIKSRFQRLKRTV